MNSNKLNYYEESGTNNALSVTLTLFCSLIFILFVSYFYSLIINFIPFIYLNFLIVVVYGFVISYTSRIFNIIFKIRNRKRSILITLILSFFAIYFQWVSFLFIISIEKFSLFMVFEEFSFFVKILFRPDIVILNMIEINKIGLWSLFGGTNVNGIFLWVVWLAEAVIIVYVAHKSFTAFEIIPFSEKDNTWFKKEFIDFDFERIAFKKKFVEVFANDPSQSILDLKQGDGIRHSKISIFSSQTESKSLITINNIIISERGKGSKDVTQVLKHCYIDNLHLTKLKEKYRIKKASIFDY